LEHLSQDFAKSIVYAANSGTRAFARWQQKSQRLKPEKKKSNLRHDCKSMP
jgi:hypothetical protein